MSRKDIQNITLKNTTAESKTDSTLARFNVSKRKAEASGLGLTLRVT